NLEVADSDAVLVFSYVGYTTQEITVGNQDVLDVSMEADFAQLDEMVVVGYGMVKKSDLTGSVVRIDQENYQNQSTMTVADMLAGTVAGFQSNQGTSASGGGSMQVRGPNSLTGGTEPLIVLDDVIYNGSLRDINPNDIESVDILKDASAAAVYGAKAASGVVLITTTKGTPGAPTINISTNVGMAEVTNRNIRPLNGEEYTNFRRGLLVMENPDNPDYYYHNPSELPNDISLEQWSNYSDSPNPDPTREWLNRLFFYPTEVENYLAGNTENFYDRVMQTAPRQSYDLSISGGTDQISYYWSLGYDDNQGIIAGDQYSTIRSRLNVNTEVTDYLDVGINTHFSDRDESGVTAELGHMLNSSPYGSMYNEDGSVKWYPNDYTGTQNPMINYYGQDQLTKVNNIFASIYSELKLPFGFSYRLSYQPRFMFTKNHNFWPSTTPNGGNSHSQGYGTRVDSQTYEWMADNLLKWNKELGIHNFDLTLLYSRERFQSWRSYQTGEGFSPNENLSFHALQYAEAHLVSNNDQTSTGDAMMGRLNYSLLGKYLFTASVRRDGYSAFGQQNPRATFPAAAFAWQISDENFFNVDLINSLKLRLSWGVNGNRDIGRYSSLATLGQTLYSNGSQTLSGTNISTLSNPGLVWERTEAFNVGLDIGLIESRINASIDVYEMTTTDLLMERSLPRITGFDNITTNLGELENRGIDVTLNTVNVDQSNFSWRSNFVFSLNRNKINRLFGDLDEEGGELPDYSNEWFPGQAIDVIWDYDITGVWQEDEVEEAAEYGLSPGDYKAVDMNGDDVYTAMEDKDFIGWRQPRYRVGLRNDISFLGNWSASVFIRADLGHMGSISAFRHDNSELYDRRGMRAVPFWTPENPTNDYGSLTASSSAYGGGYSLYFDRSFVRIQDLSLSYTLPAAYSQTMKLTSMRFYGSIRNLYSFDQWENWDPESGGSPMPRIFSIGLDIEL
ncbi:MAG: SusC/RagA family TonB-linked outer membrane protein, partial [Balneolales bacterium]